MPVVHSRDRAVLPAVGNPPPNEQCTAPRRATTLRENLLFFFYLGAFWCAKNQLRGIPKRSRAPFVSMARDRKFVTNREEIEPGVRCAMNYSLRHTKRSRDPWFRLQ